MSNHNPLIDDRMPDETLQNVSHVVTYLSVVEPIDGCEILSDDTKHGLYLLLLCVRDALDFEVGRVEKLRKGEAS